MVMGRPPLLLMKRLLTTRKIARKWQQLTRIIVARYRLIWKHRRKFSLEGYGVYRSSGKFSRENRKILLNVLTAKSLIMAHRMDLIQSLFFGRCLANSQFISS